MPINNKLLRTHKNMFTDVERCSQHIVEQKQ